MEFVVNNCFLKHFFYLILCSIVSYGLCYAQTTPISVDVAKLEILSKPDGDYFYPSFSKRQGEQGNVVIRLNIDESGAVTDVILLQSSGFPRLDRAAIDMGRGYKFSPYMIEGSPAKASTNLMIRFNLKLPEDFKGAQFVDYANLKVLSTPTEESYYPIISKEQKEEGVINLRLLIDTEGNVIEAIAFGKIEYERLRLAAVSIAKKTKFAPYIVDQKAIKIQTLTTVSFPPKASPK
jgi:TonB family protein